MRFFRWVLFFLAILFLAQATQAQDEYTFHSAEEAKRFYALTNTIRCMVCQGQSIADSNAPLAFDLREKVHQMILANHSDVEIKAFVVKRYGEWALLQPQFNRFTAFLWLFPLSALILLCLWTMRLSLVKKDHPRPRAFTRDEG